VINVWSDVAGAGGKIYVVQTSTKVVERCILMTTDPGDLVLDPTCGSGTTAFVSEEWGRRWITIDTSRVALALARTRLMSARLPYYLLADSPEGVKKETEITGRIPVYMTFVKPDGKRTLVSANRTLSVEPHEGLVRDVEKLFGRDVVSFRT